MPLCHGLDPFRSLLRCLLSLTGDPLEFLSTFFPKYCTRNLSYEYGRKVETLIKNSKKHSQHLTNKYVIKILHFLATLFELELIYYRKTYSTAGFDPETLRKLQWIFPDVSMFSCFCSLALLLICSY